MPDLILFHPGGAHGIYGSDLAKSLVALEQPLWCRIVAGALIDRGFSVEIVDAEAEGLSPLDCVGRASQTSPSLIGIVVSGHQPSGSTQQMMGAGKIARALKEAGADMPIVVLGNPSVRPPGKDAARGGGRLRLRRRRAADAGRAVARPSS